MYVSQISSSSISTADEEMELPTVPTQELIKQQQQHLGVKQTSLHTNGGEVGNNPTHGYSGLSVSGVPVSRAENVQDIPIGQVPIQQGIQLIGAMQPVSGARTSSTAHIQYLPSSQVLLEQRIELKGASQTADVMHMATDDMPTSSDETKTMRSKSLSHSISYSASLKDIAPLQLSINKDQKSDVFPSTTSSKQKPADQTAAQQYKFQHSTPLGPLVSVAVKAGQGNELPLTTVDYFTLQKQSCKSLSLVNKSMISSATSSVRAETNIKASRKRSLGQEKLIEAFVTPLPPSSKRQKVPRTVPDQGFELPDDVTLCGVDLRKEEEQLFFGHKEDSQAIKTPKRAGQEKEDMLILQKNPLHKKLAQIISKCGIKSIGKDVELCLSSCVEERLHGLTRKMRTMSKLRVEFEKQRQQIVVTSDIQHQISVMNQTFKENLGKERLVENAGRKIRDDSDMRMNGHCLKVPKAGEEIGVDVGMGKDGGYQKAFGANEMKRVIVDKALTAAANVAARAAVGGDDVTSKWQFVAQRDRQERDRGLGAMFDAQPSKDMCHVSLQTSGRTNEDCQELLEKGIENRLQEDPFLLPQKKVVRSLSVKDVIAILESEPQMSKSIFMYCAREKMYHAAAP